MLRHNLGASVIFCYSNFGDLTAKLMLLLPLAGWLSIQANSDNILSN
jgi:hypothetical protein